MPPIELMARNQWIVVWDWIAYDRYGQTVISDSPVEMKVRLVEMRGDASDEKGGPITRTIQLASLPRFIEIGSIVFLGQLRDLPSGTGSSFYEQGGLLQVVSHDRTPDIKGRRQTRTANCERFKDVLPRTSV